MPKRIVGRVEGIPPSQAGRIMGVSRQRIHQYMEDGRVEVIETPLGYLLTPQSLSDLMAELEWYHLNHKAGHYSTARYLPSLKPVPAKYKGRR